MLGGGESGVEFKPEDPVGFRGVDGWDGGVVRVNGNELILKAGGEEAAVSEGEGVVFAP
jgi:hypothetical protein